MEIGIRTDALKEEVGSLKVALLGLEAFRAELLATLIDSEKPAPEEAA
ncbi:MAG: hypothetical protein HYY18_12615 [Planctomycetes bacterium]|nr:hypothetical protein [Planctomycetota bacterium]